MPKDGCTGCLYGYRAGRLHIVTAIALIMLARKCHLPDNGVLWPLRGRMQPYVNPLDLEIMKIICWLRDKIEINQDGNQKNLEWEQIGKKKWVLKLFNKYLFKLNYNKILY